MFPSWSVLPVFFVWTPWRERDVTDLAQVSEGPGMKLRREGSLGSPRLWSPVVRPEEVRTPTLKPPG